MTYFFVVDDLWLLPVHGRLPVRLHAAAAQGASGSVAPPHSAMLRLQVGASLPTARAVPRNHLRTLEKETKKEATDLK